MHCALQHMAGLTDGVKNREGNFADHQRDFIGADVAIGSNASLCRVWSMSGLRATSEVVGDNPFLCSQGAKASECRLDGLKNWLTRKFGRLQNSDPCLVARETTPPVQGGLGGQSRCSGSEGSSIPAAERSNLALNHGRRERNFWMQRRSAKNRHSNGRTPAETKIRLLAGFGWRTFENGQSAALVRVFGNQMSPA